MQRSDLPPGFASKESELKASQGRPVAMVAVLIFTVIGLFVLLSFAAQFKPNPLPLQPPTPEAVARDFWDRGVKMARDRLKAPSTAVFSRWGAEGSGYTYENDQKDLILWGTVDAENGFGAKLRNTWRMDMKLNEAGQFRPTDFRMAER